MERNGSSGGGSLRQGNGTGSFRNTRRCRMLRRRVLAGAVCWSVLLGIALAFEAQTFSGRLKRVDTVTGSMVIVAPGGKGLVFAVGSRVSVTLDGKSATL